MPPSAPLPPDAGACLDKVVALIPLYALGAGLPGLPAADDQGFHRRVDKRRLFRHYYRKNNGIADMYSRILDLPERSFFLFGPRGTGKSVWLEQRLGHADLIGAS